jgi:hypothetical protein
MDSDEATLRFAEIEETDHCLSHVAGSGEYGWRKRGCRGEICQACCAGLRLVKKISIKQNGPLLFPVQMLPQDTV